MDSRLYESLCERGLIEQASHVDELRDALGRGGESIYVGFDPTAASLHVGHLLPILALAHLQRGGHRPVILIGGATGMIGDPSGRSAERNLIDLDEVAANSAKIREQLARFVSFDGDAAAVMVNNADWTLAKTHVEWLRDVGKHFTVNYMLSKESVRRRLEDRDGGISYTEFSYMLLQAHDFLHLFSEHGCRIQAGGNDQWGNITAGIDLIRKVRGQTAFGITFPLVTSSSGEKFGKSEGNAVWLDPNRTSPFRFYQYWIRTDDADVSRFLRLFTFLTIMEIEAALSEHAGDPGARTAQRLLAQEVTRLVHGTDALERAERASAALFGGDLTALTSTEIHEVFAEVPSTSLPRTLLAEGLDATTLLATSGLCASRGAARRLIDSGGAYVNNGRVPSADKIVGEDSLLPGNVVLLRSGKKSYLMVHFV